MSTDKTSFDGGKYTIQLDNNTGELQVLRHGESWVKDEGSGVPMSKMLIGIMYEVSKLRKLLSEVETDVVSVGLYKKIKEYEEHFNVDLRYVEDIN